MFIPKSISDEIDKHITAKDIAEMEAMTEDDWLKWDCERMNRNLEPVYKREYMCPKCHNSGVYFVVQEQEYTKLNGEKARRKDIVGVICNCGEK